MAEQPTPGTTPAVSPGNTPAPAATNTTPEPQAGDGQDTMSLEEARKLRKENQTLRQRQKALDDAQAAADAAALSESQKATKRAEAAEAQIQLYKKQLVDAKVELAAKAKGIINPTIAAVALREISAFKLEYDDDGMPTNLEKVLDDLIKGNPYLVEKVEPASPAQTTPALPVGNPGRSNIQSPGQTPGRIPGWNEVFKRP